MDERPPVWVGHVVLPVSDVGRAAQWWSGIGMRELQRNPDVAILELRGGTHLVLVPGAPNTGGAPFDLMVEDLDATHASWSDLGVDVSDIRHGSIHDDFTATDPDGYVVTVSNSHVVGPV